MSRAYDDVFSHGLLAIEPALTFAVHVLRDPVFTPEGVALELTPVGVPRIAVARPLGPPVVLHWDLDDRSHLLAGEELVVEPLLRPAPAEIRARFRSDLGDRIWRGELPPDTVHLHQTRTACQAAIDAKEFPSDPAWRVAWGYEMVLVTRTRIEERMEGWVILESA